MPVDYSDLYNSSGRQYGVDPLYLQAMAQQEDPSGDPNAISSAGAQGVMQLEPKTARSLGVTDSTNPQQNIPAGANYYSQMKSKYNDPNLALMAYNWGPGAVDNWIKNGANPEEIPEETRNYVKKVNQNYKNLQQPKTVIAATTPAAYVTNSSTEVDPLDARAAETTNTNATEEDPLDARAAGKDLTPQIAAAQKAKTKPASVGILADVAETVPTGIVRGIGAIPQIPAMFGNLAAQTEGYLYGRGHNLLSSTPYDQATLDKLSNVQPFYTGDTLADVGAKVGAALAEGIGGNSLTSDQKQRLEQVEKVGLDNPLGLHEPQTIPGRLTAAALEGGISGPASGLRKAASIGGALGGQVAQEALPNNPLATIAGGIAGGGVTTASRAINLRDSPVEVAHKIIQDNVRSGSGPTPPGGFGSNALQQNAINPTEIIPGSRPTLAETTADPNLAVLERQQQMQDPSTFAANEAQRELARKSAFEKASGTPQDVEAMKTQRESDTTPLYEQARTQPLNPDAISPVLQKIDEAIDQVGDGSEAGKTLASIKAKIKGAMPTTVSPKSGTVLDAQGNPVAGGAPIAKNTTQSPLIQIYREERDNLQKPSTADGAYAATVKSVIQPIIGELGDALESQSEPFAKAQQIYRETSPKIDAAQWMQSLKLTDATGKFTLAKVANALQNAKKMQSAPGLNSAKSLEPYQMQALQDLHDDLLRRESVARASMPRNSTTVQNAIAQKAMNSGLLGRANQLYGGNLPQSAGALLGSTLGSALGHPSLGAYLGEGAGSKISRAMSGKAAETSGHLKNFLIDPETYKQYLADRLNDNFSNRFKQNLFNNP